MGVSRRFGIRVLVGARDFCLFKTIQPFSGPTVPGIQWAPVFFLGVKRPGFKVDHPPPSGPEVKNKWRYTSAPSIRLSYVATDSFALFFYLVLTSKF